MDHLAKDNNNIGSKFVRPPNSREEAKFPSDKPPPLMSMNVPPPTSFIHPTDPRTPEQSATKCASVDPAIRRSNSHPSLSSKGSSNSSSIPQFVPQWSTTGVLVKKNLYKKGELTDWLNTILSECMRAVSTLATLDDGEGVPLHVLFRRLHAELGPYKYEHMKKEFGLSKLSATMALVGNDARFDNVNGSFRMKYTPSDATLRREQDGTP
ncbi:hypothetical protein AAVH_13798 [Aphelenchoides avenae]|nr:hypothetical protein AAVH_13798 [Aphelenchus avenae]